MKRSILILILAVLYGCKGFFDLEDPTIGINSESILSINLEEHEIVANGFDYVIGTIELGEMSDPNKIVKLKANTGKLSFIPLTDTSNSTNQLNLPVRSKTANFIYTSSLDYNKGVIISAELDSIIVFDTIATKKAFGDIIYVTVDNKSVTIGQDVNLTCHLIRKVGAVSNHLEIILEQIFPKSSDTVMVVFPPLIFTQNGKGFATIQNINDSSGVLTILVSHPVEGSKPLSDTIQISYAKE